MNIPLEGNVGVIKAKVVHKDFKNLDHYIAKHNAYSTWEANGVQLKSQQKPIIIKPKN
jgi:hypothetical protein